VFGAVVFAVALPIARRNGGWGKALGLTRPTGADSGPFFATTGIQLGLRFFLGIVLVLLVPALRHEHVSNLTGVGQLGPVGIVMLVIAACIVAPIVEELAFRGVMLRAIMRRISFWPAAVLSSLVFGLLHAPTAPNAAGVVVVIMLTFVFGVVQCVLVRRTGRLAPAIGVHAITNAIALAIALAAASS
jgi:membrane protease YdiL (CAAX protease family)